MAFIMHPNVIAWAKSLQGAPTLPKFRIWMLPWADSADKVVPKCVFR